ncbi:MAG TPA: protein translocase subunit SecF [Methanophagales archaeon]|nr:protein translocase subunit SecF [Methanophagales archaeon]
MDITKVMSGKESFFDKVDITKYSAKKLIAIPIIVLLLAFAMIAYTQISVGSPVHLGMDFTGGTWVKISTDETKEELTTKFDAYPIILVGETGVGNEKRIEFDLTSESSEYDMLIEMLDNGYGAGTYELASISAQFGRQYQTQALYALIIAFILMAIVVFVVFRMVIPPLAVIFAAFSDIVVAIACMNLIGLELSLGTVAALLMLIGYSVDSNILLTTNLLRKKGDLDDKIRNAMRTGITMTFTTLSAVFAMFLVSSSLHLLSTHFALIPILMDISLVLLFGLVMDLANTWLLNAGILKLYLEKKESKKFKRKKGVEKPKVTKKDKSTN